MKLYSDDSQYSHRVRLALAEKGIIVDRINIDAWSDPAEFVELNPGGRFPVLDCRDNVLLTRSDIILEYLEERFPNKPLMPLSPKERAKCRQEAWRLEEDVCMPAQEIMNSTRAKTAKARERLTDNLYTLLPVFRDTEWFMGNEFSILDCILGPLLWRLPTLEIEIPVKSRSRPMYQYMQRSFMRNAFKLTLTDTERDIHIRKRAKTADQDKDKE